ncbi:MAG: hypothetical protein SF052_13165 [Bacteroidia bacterium]|nr:hypothetical protein [Bacteroidia bacterium]
MPPFIFDIRGNIQPGGIIEMEMAEFESFFVKQFDFFEERMAIFENFTRYNRDLSHLIGIGFVQWINGSFVSNKETPKDIDFVTFIDWKTYTHHKKEIDSRFSKWAVANNYEKLDAYTICEYPQGHRFHQTFLADRAYWYEWFSNSRYTRTKQRFPKGFVEIKTL